jgi:hypothetical protein
VCKCPFPPLFLSCNMHTYTHTHTHTHNYTHTYVRIYTPYATYSGAKVNTLLFITRSHSKYGCAAASARPPTQAKGFFFYCEILMPCRPSIDFFEFVFDNILQEGTIVESSDIFCNLFLVDVIFSFLLSSGGENRCGSHARSRSISAAGTGV